MLKNKKINVKSKAEIEKMIEGGKKLARIKRELRKNVKEGVRASEIENLANKLIEKEGGKPSFKMVEGYEWATCVNVNDGVVHGIPGDIVFKKGDIVSVDSGMFFKGFHTDTSFTVFLGTDSQTEEFLSVGKLALKKGISKAQSGLKVYDISEAIEAVLKKHGLSPVRALVGHGIGKELHEEPQIPCFTSGKRASSPTLPENAALAIEVMYSKGGGNVKLASDGWTIVTSDGTISALFEETVLVAKNGPLVLTNWV